MHAAGLRRRSAGIGFAILVGENGDEPAIAGIKIKMAFGSFVEIGLLEYEGHAEHAFPEIDRRLAVGARQRDVVYTLALQFLHGVPYQLDCSTSSDFTTLGCKPRTMHSRSTTRVPSSRPPSSTASTRCG